MKLTPLKSSILIKPIGFLILFTLLSCKSQQILFPPPVLAFTDLIDFCDLPNHKNEGVYTRAIYSGVDEYWVLKAVDKNCKDSANVELEIPDKLNIKSEHNRLLKEVHEKYWKYYLIIDAIGTFKTDNLQGYGHLGTNQSAFVVEKIIAIQKIMRRKNSPYQATDSHHIKKDINPMPSTYLLR